MEKQVTGAEDQIMAWLTEAMELLEETGEEMRADTVSAGAGGFALPGSAGSTRRG